MTTICKIFRLIAHKLRSPRIFFHTNSKTTRRFPKYRRVATRRSLETGESQLAGTLETGESRLAGTYLGNRGVANLWNSKNSPVSKVPGSRDSPVSKVWRVATRRYLGNQGVVTRRYGTYPTYKLGTVDSGLCRYLKGQSHEIFCTQFISSISSFWSH